MPPRARRRVVHAFILLVLSFNSYAQPSQNPDGSPCTFTCPKTGDDPQGCKTSPCICFSGPNGNLCAGTWRGSTPTPRCVIDRGIQGVCFDALPPPRLVLNSGQITGIVIAILAFLGAVFFFIWRCGGPIVVMRAVRNRCEAQPCCQRKIKPKLVVDWAATTTNPLRRGQGGGGGAEASSPQSPAPGGSSPKIVAFEPIRGGVPPPDGMGDVYDTLHRMGLSTTNV